jgi:hypothetical protein
LEPIEVILGAHISDAGVQNFTLQIERCGDRIPIAANLIRLLDGSPVAVSLTDDWEWSSFRHYATGIEGRVEIESEWATGKRERAAGRLCLPVELPHSSQKKA